MEVFTGSNATLDLVTDERTLVKYAPDAMNDRFDAIKTLREGYEAMATYTNHGRIVGGHNYKHVASIPAPLLAAALCIEPDLMVNKRKFFSWLDKHPGYQTVERKRGRTR